MNDAAQINPMQTDFSQAGVGMTGSSQGDLQLGSLTPSNLSQTPTDVVVQSAPKSSMSGATSDDSTVVPGASPSTPTSPLTTSAPTDLTDLEKLDILNQVIDQVEKDAVSPSPPGQDPLQPDGVSPASPASSQISPQTSLAPPPPQSQGSAITDASVLDQVLPQAVQALDPLNPPQASQASASSKEKLASSSGVDQVSPDTGTGIQYVEQEKNPEIPVEVESYLQKVEDNSDNQVHEVVIADGTVEVAGTAYPSRPVIVLPITQQMEKEGAKKSPKFSIRWLVEWSQKIIKIFAGKVVYRDN